MYNPPSYPEQARKYTDKNTGGKTYGHVRRIGKFLARGILEISRFRRLRGFRPDDEKFLSRKQVIGQEDEQQTENKGKAADTEKP